MVEMVINTSWAAALLCFVAAAGYGWFWRNGWFAKSAVANTVILSFWGLCYIGTQFGPDWFIVNQRAFFRLASTGAVLANLYFIYSMYIFAKPITKAATNGSKQQSHHPD